jgi:HK97 family phage portal protein
MINPAARLTKFGALKAEIDLGKMPEWMLSRAQSASWDMPDPGVYENQASLYARLSWVYSAVSIVGQTCALQAINIKRLRGEKTKDIDNHPFEMLLMKPNPLQSRFEFLRDTVSFSAINGNAYWWLNRSAPNQPPTEMWLLPSWRVTPVPDGKMYLAGYNYEPGAGLENITLPLWQVVHQKTFNPMNEFIGISSVEPVAISAQTDLESQKWSGKFYGKNNARLPGILAFKDQIANEIAWERIKYDVAQAAETRNILMLRGVGDRVEWLRAAATQEEMQQLEQRQFTKEEVYSVFAPGLASMLAINATEANSKAGKQTFLEMAIWPRLVEIAQKVTLDILPAYGKSLTAEFDDPRQTDRMLELKEQEAYGISHTIDEIRQQYYEDDPIGDVRGTLLPVQFNVTSSIDLRQEFGPEQAPKPEAQPIQLIIGSDQINIPGEQRTSEPEEPEEVEERQEEAAMRAALSAWRRKALKSFKAGHGATVIFEDASIPPDLHADIWAQLSACKSATDVREVFEQAISEGEPVKIDKLLIEKVEALEAIVKKSAWVMYP